MMTARICITCGARSALVIAHELRSEFRHMAHKQVLFRSAAREKILRGSAQLADTVGIRLGPKCKSVRNGACRSFATAVRETA
jgi:hypothetical protein